MKYTTTTMKVLSTAFVLGSISVAHANGTVKCPTPPHRHHVPKCHKPMHEACPAPTSCFVSGFYAGLQAGYSLLHGKYKND